MAISDGMKVRTDDNVVKTDMSGTVVPLPTGAATSAKQLADNHQVNANQRTVPWVVANTLVPFSYDNLVCTYTGTDLTSVVYKTGVTTVATLTMTYNATHDILTVTRT